MAGYHEGVSVVVVMAPVDTQLGMTDWEDCQTTVKKWSCFGGIYWGDLCED